MSYVIESVNGVVHEANWEATTADDGRVVSWRLECECGAGWVSQALTCVDSPAEEDVERGRVCEQRSFYLDERPGVDAWISDALGAHAESDAVERVRRAADARTRAEDALDDAIEDARGLGATWQAIGAAVGMSTQGAQQRWSKRRGIA